MTKPKTAEERFVERAMAANAKMYPTDKPKKDTRKLSAKAKKAEELIQSGKFGCNTNQVAELVSILLGEEVIGKKPSATAPLGFVPGAVIVPLTNPNSHDYKIGVPIYVKVDYSGCVQVDGSRGNHMSCDRSASRPATKDEIISFYREYMKKVILLD